MWQELLRQALKAVLPKLLQLILESLDRQAPQGASLPPGGVLAVRQQFTDEQVAQACGEAADKIFP